MAHRIIQSGDQVAVDFTYEIGTQVSLIDTKPKQKYKVEVQVGNDPKWYSNALKFDTKELAQAYGKDLTSRWLATKDFRVVEVKQ